ncbi:hypothetical protein E4K10_01505 [Streptomyces sp. T1317-0309]|nr:hypothetical protein E4K10_01505 [Streptomyces sp. T1317-0309]
MLDVFLVVGFLLAIFLIDRVGRVPLQLVGFAVMAVAHLCPGDRQPTARRGRRPSADGADRVRALQHVHESRPERTTFALPAEVFPSEIRSAGHGFAAGCGKLGAALGTFLFPVLLAGIGQAALLYAVAAACALGFLITLVFRVEPRGVPRRTLRRPGHAARTSRHSPVRRRLTACFVRSHIVAVVAPTALGLGHAR